MTVSMAFLHMLPFLISPGKIVNAGEYPETPPADPEDPGPFVEFDENDTATIHMPEGFDPSQPALPPDPFYDLVVPKAHPTSRRPLSKAYTLSDQRAWKKALEKRRQKNKMARKARKKNRR